VFKPVLGEVSSLIGFLKPNGRVVELLNFIA